MGTPVVTPERDPDQRTARAHANLEKLGPADLTLASDELAQLTAAADRVGVHGDRYDATGMSMVGL